MKLTWLSLGFIAIASHASAAEQDSGERVAARSIAIMKTAPKINERRIASCERWMGEARKQPNAERQRRDIWDAAKTCQQDALQYCRSYQIDAPASACNELYQIVVRP